MKLIKPQPSPLPPVSPQQEELFALIDELYEFEECVRCRDCVQVEALDLFGRCPPCGDGSELRLVK